MTRSATTPTTLCLRSIAAALLAVAVSGCCQSTTEVENFQGDLEEDVAAEIRGSNADDEARCEQACTAVIANRYDLGDVFIDSVDACEAAGDDAHLADPWNPENTLVSVTCTATLTFYGGCTGRRPLGHREADIDARSPGGWLALQAHLERASVTAFHELASWLTLRAAPAALIDRCRAAADDEVRHAARLSELARAAGAEVPPAEADAARDDVFEVALHNATEGCVGEAFAAVVALYQARSAHGEELRGLFRGLADDELRHGQLAWDLHSWLLAQLSPAQAQAVLEAQRRAFAELPARIAAFAAATPLRFGWPAPEVAAAMAEGFAQRVEL
ncbi:MAG: ferritin-like domain-containing protein, partial [Myxococcales bacterium]|nr:ferritin-like domain-containing protein [Myxococcales bacterium]